MSASSKRVFILASSSPRRKYLLSQVGLSFRVHPPEMEEIPRRGEKAESFVKRVSEEKAMWVADRLDLRFAGALVLGADTVVVPPQGKTGGTKWLGKPKSSAEAARMLGKISGKRHSVLTGYTIIDVSKDGKVKKHSRVIKTQVKIRSLSRAQIKAYLSLGESMDKAGAYAAQGRGNAIIEEIRGSFTNVVGLPVTHVFQDLEKRFQYELFGKS